MVRQLLRDCRPGPNLGRSRGPLTIWRFKMMRFINELWTDESGQDATEYVLLVVLIALAITAGMTVLATGINGAFSNASTTLNTTTGS